MKRLIPLLLALLLAACQTAAPSIASTTATLPAAATTRPSATALPPTVEMITRAVQATSAPTPTAETAAVPETPVQIIPLSGPAASDGVEVSALGWYADTLVIVPQYPRRWCEQASGCLFALPRAEIEAFLDGSNPGPLQPRPVPLSTGGLENSIRSFEGFESIAFHGDSVYMTIEASPGSTMTSTIVRGSIAPDLSAITLDPATRTEITQPAYISNFSHEATLIDDERVLVFYEANGAAYAQDGYAQVAAFSLDLAPLTTTGMQPLEFRTTDVFPRAGVPGGFWLLNTFFPGDMKIYPQSDPLAEQFGQGASHAEAIVVERIVPMQIAGDSITISGAPLQLQLENSLVSRNWEGMVELPGRGFLLMTDTYPTTLLGFVPW